MLTMPKAFRSSGVVYSFGQLWVAGYISYLSILCLVYAAYETKKFSYSALSQHCYGPVFRIYVDIVFFLNNFGTALSYMILVDHPL